MLTVIHIVAAGVLVCTVAFSPLTIRFLNGVAGALQRPPTSRSE